jgi:uncharacterized protein YqgC (DUF456 family)
VGPEVGPLLVVTLLAMLVGLVGSVLPGLPGVTLIFLSAAVYSFLTDFDFVGVAVLLILFLLAAVAFVADFFATSYGARRFGASNWGTVGGALGGLVGALIGLLFVGIGSIFGLIFGTIGGIFLGEYLRRRRQGSGGQNPGGQSPAGGDWRRTTRAAGGVFVGFVASAIAQGLLGLLSVVVFVLALVY